MNDTLIACVLADVRAAAIHEEMLRLGALHQANPPNFPSHVAFIDEVATTTPNEG